MLSLQRENRRFGLPLVVALIAALLAPSQSAWGVTLLASESCRMREIAPLTAEPRDEASSPSSPELEWRGASAHDDCSHAPDSECMALSCAVPPVCAPVVTQIRYVPAVGKLPLTVFLVPTSRTTEPALRPPIA